MEKYKKKTRFSLDEKILNGKFNFCKNLKWFLIAPIVIILVGVILLCTLGFNLGIDFTGGSNMTIFIDKDGSYGTQYDINKDYGEIERVVNGVLQKHNFSISSMQKTTMVVDDDQLKTSGDAVIVKFQNNSDDELNETIRKELLEAFGYSEDDGESALVANGGITMASASAELMMNSFIALLVAVVVILIYVAFRFEITSGLAAILALFHDLLVTASIVLICRIEINVSFIAALITILGYSINNTIIIFDRMRDEVKFARNADKKIVNEDIANLSVRQTMTRSILTTLTTFLMIFFVTVIGVANIREFAFPIMIGILAGFYSSVFITPGLWAIAYKPRKKKKSTNATTQKSKKKDAFDEFVEGEDEQEMPEQNEVEQPRNKVNGDEVEIKNA